jgi:hypothetical protein
MNKILTDQERADIKVDVFRLCSQLVANDETLKAAAEAPDPYKKAIAAEGVDLQRVLAIELHHRDVAFVSIVDADPDTGIGHYVDGEQKTKKFTFKMVDGGPVVLTPMVAPPTNAVTALGSYAPALDKLRAAEGPSFEEKYKAERRAAFAAEYARGK